MQITLVHYLVLGAILFIVGGIGVIVRRNVLTVLMSIELMLNAANLTFVAFSRFPLVSGQTTGQLMGGHASAFFVIAVAAAEAAVGLAILIAVFRKRETTHVDELTLLRDYPANDEVEAPVAAATALHAPAAHAETH